MVFSVVLTLLYIFIPVLLIYLSERVTVVEKVGAVLLAYAIGLLIGNSGLIEYVENYKNIQEIFNNITIPLALPLLLFPLDIKKWVKNAGKAVVALIVLLFSVIVSVASGYFIFENKIDDAWKVSGMLMGVYSGGTPNLASITAMLNVSPEDFVMVNTLDIIVSSVYLLFLMTAGKFLFRKILPKYKFEELTVENGNYQQDENNYRGILKRENIFPVLQAVGYSLLIVIISIGISFFITGTISMLVLILSITTLSIVASLFKQINSIKYTFQAGMYLIVIFCMVVASMADISELGAVAFDILEYISFVVFGSLLIKTLLSKIFKIDADTLIVSSTALICSPPFVPVMGGVLKNKQIIVTGLTIGIIGYAVGNYLGVTIAYLLR
jgi:uncharacterized membrane protein